MLYFIAKICTNYNGAQTQKIVFLNYAKGNMEIHRMLFYFKRRKPVAINVFTYIDLIIENFQ